MAKGAVRSAVSTPGDHARKNAVAPGEHRLHSHGVAVTRKRPEAATATVSSANLISRRTWRARLRSTVGTGQLRWSATLAPVVLVYRAVSPGRRTTETRTMNTTEPSVERSSGNVSTVSNRFCLKNGACKERRVRERLPARVHEAAGHTAVPGPQDRQPDGRTLHPVRNSEAPGISCCPLATR